MKRKKDKRKKKESIEKPISKIRKLQRCKPEIKGNRNRNWESERNRLLLKLLATSTGKVESRGGKDGRMRGERNKRKRN